MSSSYNDTKVSLTISIGKSGDSLSSQHYLSYNEDDILSFLLRAFNILCFMRLKSHGFFLQILFPCLMADYISTVPGYVDMFALTFSMGFTNVVSTSLVS
jgi:hypothetical protein